MSIYETTHGNAYANDPDYDRLSGRVTYHAEITGITLDGWKVKHTVAYIDLGRCADVVPVDPDRQLADEYLPEFVHRPGHAAALMTIRENKAQRRRELIQAIIACLREYGPASANTLTDRLGNGAYARVLDALRTNPQTFVLLGGKFTVWGLPGQTYTPQSVRLGSKLRDAIHAALVEHGPQTARELCQRLNADQTSVSKSLLRFGETFAVVEVRPGMGIVPPTRVWGLVQP